MWPIHYIIAYILALLFLVNYAALALAKLICPIDQDPFHPPSRPVGSFYRLLSFCARFTAAFGALMFCALYGIFASIALRLVGYGGLAQWTTARAFKYVLWLTTSVWFDIVNEGQGWWFKEGGEGGQEGKDGGEWLKTRPAVIVGNHQTELDILMLGTVFPKYTSVTAKKSLIWVPFLGQFMALSKTVFINRGSRKDALAAFGAAAETMKTQKQNVFIFPEGTRTYADEPKLAPFKKGAFHLAVQAQVPIVPVVVANYSNILSFRKRHFWGGRVPMKILKPVETKGLTSKDVDALTQKVYEAMSEEYVKLSERQGIMLKSKKTG